VNEFDTGVFDLLDVFTPEPRRWPDWHDVRRRARVRRTQRLLVGIAASVVVLGSAAGVTAALGGFHAWISGSPGKPAPRSEQERFQDENTRSYGAFPKDTKLRELIRTHVGGEQYVLFGFRSGDSLCLRLKSSIGHTLGPTCAPVARLVHATAPILPIVGNGGFEDGQARPSAAVSYGIAADGVSEVVVRAVDGDHRAVVEGNAYLWVQDKPNTGQSALSVTAVTPASSPVTLPIARLGGPYVSQLLPTRPARGPRHVERRIKHPTVAWYVRGEKRGMSLRDVRRVSTQGNAGLDDTARLIKPDRLSNALVGLSGKWCLVVVAPPDSGPALSCSPGRQFWLLGPMNYMLSSEGDLFGRISGVVADGVARVVVFLGDGRRQPASLRDNLFTALVANDEFPIRLAAYDQSGRVVGIVTPHIFGAGGRRIRGSFRRAFEVRGPRGAVATARVGRANRGVRCWRVDMSTGQSPAACIPRVSGAGLWVDLVQPAGKDLFVIGHAFGPAKRIQLEFQNGDVVHTRPVDGLFIFAIPSSHLSPARQIARLRGYPMDGSRRRSVGVVFRVRR
jgi:hypothetical protein